VEYLAGKLLLKSPALALQSPATGRILPNQVLPYVGGDAGQRGDN
jgi:hypothetical protein